MNTILRKISSLCYFPCIFRQRCCSRQRQLSAQGRWTWTILHTMFRTVAIQDVLFTLTKCILMIWKQYNKKQEHKAISNRGKQFVVTQTLVCDQIQWGVCWSVSLDITTAWIGPKSQSHQNTISQNAQTLSQSKGTCMHMQPGRGADRLETPNDVQAHEDLGLAEEWWLFYSTGSINLLAVGSTFLSKWFLQEWPWPKALPTAKRSRTQSAIGSNDQVCTKKTIHQAKCFIMSINAHRAANIDKYQGAKFCVVTSKAFYSRTCFEWLSLW